MSFNGVFIIAEIGINHNGDVNIAKKMINKAKESGADAVKFQTFKAEKLVTKKAAKADYQVKNTKNDDSQYEMLKKLELTEDDFKELYQYCKEKAIGFISTPFDIESADFLFNLGVESFKLSSGDLTNTPLIKHIAKFDKDIIISTGMANDDEISDAVNAAKIMKDGKVYLLHCTSNYPANFSSLNLKCISTLSDKFNLECGYSDHSKGIEASIAAAALGARIIEKHFTLDCSMDGPDHRASIEPKEFASMVKAIRNIEVAIGDGIKRCTEEERNTALVARKSIVAKRPILKGDKIGLDDLEYKRPGDGVAPSRYNDFIGKVALKDISLDEKILFESVE